MKPILILTLAALLLAGTAAANPNDGELRQINATHWCFETTQTNIAYGTYGYQAFANNISSDYRILEYAYASFAVVLTAKDIGPDGNAVVTTETGTNTSFAQTTLTGGHNSDLEGAWAEDTMPTGSGLWSDVGGMLFIALIIGVVAIIIGYLRRVQ